MSTRTGLIGLVAATTLGWVTSSLAASPAAKAGLECGVGAAVAGGALCELMHPHDHAKCAAIAVVAGGAGAIACSTYAKHLDARSHELQGKEHDLDAQIHYVRELNTDTEKLNSDLAQRVSTMTSDTDKVVGQINQMSQAQVQQERQKRDDMVNVSQQEVRKGTEALQKAKDLRAQESSAPSELDAAIAHQEQLLQQAQREVDLMSQQRARV
jgi:hypothetical protein